MNLTIWLTVWTSLSVAVIATAFGQHKQFYPSVVHMIQSKPSLAVLIIQAILSIALLVKLSIKLFFGQLSANEFENLREYVWPAVLDSCFAFAVFARSANNFFYVRLLCLFYLKAVHFMAHSRVNSMAALSRMPKFFHTRFIGLLLSLSIADIFQIAVSANRIIRFGPSVEIMFLFEHTMLFFKLMHVFGEYVLEYMDQNSGANGWDEKVVYQNYLELLVESCKAVSHMVAIKYLLRMGVFPIFMARRAVVNFKNAKNSFNKVVQSLRAIARMDSFPQPRPEDLQQDSMCSICRDEIQAVELAKKLFCRHVFHTSCLKAWFRRQQRCPTCRANVITAEAN